MFYAKNVRTTVVLGHARGVVLLAGAQAGVDVYEYPARRDQEGGGRVRRRDEGAGAVHAHATASAEGGAVAIGCRRRCRGGADVSHERAPAEDRRGAIARTVAVFTEANRDRGSSLIAQVFGRLVTREIDHVEIMTEGGVAYELAIPLSAYEALPKVGDTATLHTHLVVREDGWQLYGFATPFERRVFRRVLDAKGVGPALALGMLSALSAERLVRAIRERDIATLQSVPRVGRKKAEQLVLDLADKLDELAGDARVGAAAGRRGRGRRDPRARVVRLHAGRGREGRARGAGGERSCAVGDGADPERAREGSRLGCWLLAGWLGCWFVARIAPMRAGTRAPAAGRAHPPWSQRARGSVLGRVRCPAVSGAKRA